MLNVGEFFSFKGHHTAHHSQFGRAERAVLLVQGHRQLPSTAVWKPQGTSRGAWLPGRQ